MRRSRLPFSLMVLMALVLLGPSPGQIRPALAADVMFGCLGFPQYFSVPPSVTQITVIAEGAAGGDVSAAPAPGLGGSIAGTLSTVTFAAAARRRRHQHWSRSSLAAEASTLSGSADVLTRARSLYACCHSSGIPEIAGRSLEAPGS